MFAVISTKVKSHFGVPVPVINLKSVHVSFFKNVCTVEFW